MSNLTYDISGLDDGELYEFVVYSANESGSSYDSSMVSVRTIPGVPTGLDLSARVLSMYYKFAAMPGAVSYTLYYGTTTDASGSFFTTTSVSGTINNLIAGQLYYVKVSSTNTSGESAKSATAVSEYVTPAVPTGLVADGDVNHIDISYSSVSCNGYNVYYSVSGGSYVKHNTGLITQTTYNVSSLLAGTQYNIYVKSVRLSVENGAQIESAASSIVNAFTIPDVPQITDINPNGVDTLRVTFTPEIGATSYKVCYGLTNGALNLSMSAVTGSPVDITGLVDGKRYYFQVTAINSGGESARSNTLSEYTMPSMPSAPTAVGGVNKVTISFNAVSDCDGYNLYWRIFGGTYEKYTSISGLIGGISGPINISGIIAQTTFTVPSLAAGTYYNFYMKAVRLSIIDGTQIESNGSGAAYEYTLADVPAITSLTSGVNKITTAFTTEIGAASYKIYYGLVSGALDLSKGSVTASPVDITGLTSGKLYYFQTTSINPDGRESAKSTTKSEYVTPAVPTITVAVGDVQKIRITYTAIADSNGYNVYYRKDNSGSYLKHNTALITGTTYDISSLLAGTAYNSFVKSVRLSISGGTEIESSLSNVDTTYTIADVPAITSLTTGGSRITVVFTPETGATSYKVYYGLTSSAIDLSKASIFGSPVDITGLTSGKLYYFKITSINPDGIESAFSTIKREYVIPTAPTGLVANGGVNKVTVTYNSVADSSGYNVYISGAGSSYAKHNTALITGTTYEALSLDPGTQYDFYAKSVRLSISGGSQIESGASVSDTAYTIADVPAITGLTTGYLHNNKIGVAFTTETGATSYKVYYGLTSGALDLSNGTVTASPVDICGLISGKRYYFQVTSINLGGESARSNTMSEYVTPPSPTTYDVYASANKVSVSYYGVSESDGYNVYISISGATFVKHNTALITNLTYEISSLAAGTQVSLFVRSVRIPVNGSTQIVSLPSFTSTHLYTPPDIPEITNLTTGIDKVTVAFTPEIGALSYKVYYGLTSSALDLSIVVLTASPVDITGLTSGKLYYFQVTAINSGGESEKSTQFSRSVIPAIPQNVSIVGGVNKVIVSFTDIADKAGYNVYYKTESGSFQKYNTLALVSGSPYELTGLTAGERYYVYVRSVVYSNNSTLLEIESADSSTVNAYVIPDVTAVTSTSALTTTISVAFDTEYGATSYKVYYGIVSGVYDLSKSGVTSSPTTLSALTSGTTYYIAATTLNAAGESAKSTQLSQITRALPPTGLVAVGKVGTGAIDISYVAAVGASSYTIRYGLSGSFTDSINVSGTTAELTGLFYGYYYNIKVSSNNAAGESETESSTVYTITIGNAPSIITISGKTREIQISIPEVTGTTSYKVYYGTVTSGAYDLSRTFTATGATTEVFTLNNLLDGTEYNVKATTINGAGESPFSISQSSITIPGKPSFASVVAGFEEVSVIINNQTGAESYTVYYGEEGSFTESQVFTSLTGDITGLIDGRNYNFRVTATNESGESVYSDVVYERIIPDQPGDNTISAIGYYDKITVTINRFEGASEYIVYYGVSGDFSSSTSVIDPSGSATSISIDISGLQAGKYYGFRYTTKKTDLNSPTESEPSIDIAYARIAPAMPTFVQAVGGVRKATLTFTPVEGATRYVVKYRKIGETAYTEYSAFYV